MKQKFLFSFLLSFVLILVLSGCGTSSMESASKSSDSKNTVQGGNHRFKISHLGPDSHIWTKVMNKFNEELEVRSDGRLSLEIYTNAVLGNEPDMMKQLNAGSLDMAFISTAELTNRSESFNVWFMPFLIKDSNMAKALTETEEAKGIINTLSKDEGVHALGYNFIETRHILMRDSSISDLDDIKGKKIRVIPSPVIIDWWKTLGTAPTPIPLPDVYTSLQTGVIDGLDIGPMAVMTSKFNEVGNSLTKTNHMMLIGVSFVSQKVWDTLTSDEQKIIQDAFDEARKYNFELSQKEERDSFVKFEEQGGKITNIDNTQPVLEKAEKFISKYAESDEKMKAFIEKARELSSK